MNATAMMYLSRALVMLIAIPFHEAAHAFVSWKLGDSTAKDYGRLTLNPIAHFDPMGAICMIVAGVGWAKPVPTNAGRFRNPKAGMALTALAGPVSNLLLAYISMILFKLVYYFTPDMLVFSYLLLFLKYMIIINVTLAVFNLLPVPPFDGSRILGLVLPEKLYFALMKYERYTGLVVLALVFFGLFDGILAAANGYVYAAINWATGWIDLIFSAALG